MKYLKTLLIKNPNQNIWTVCVCFQQIIREVSVKGNASQQCSPLRAVETSCHMCYSQFWTCNWKYQYL